MCCVICSCMQPQDKTSMLLPHLSMKHPSVLHFAWASTRHAPCEKHGCWLQVHLAGRSARHGGGSVPPLHPRGGG